MYISQINANQPSNRGYVDKSLKTRVNSIVEKEVLAIVDSANSNFKPVNNKEIQAIRDLGTRVIDKLNNYVSKLNKNTGLKFETLWYTDGAQLSLSNNNTSLSLHDSFSRKSQIVDNHLFFIKGLVKNLKTITDLAQFEKNADEIEQIAPEEVDRAMFLKKFEQLKNNASGKKTILGQIKDAYSRYKAEKIAKEFEVNDGTTSWAGTLRVAQNRQIIQTQRRAQVIKENNKLAKEILEK